MKKFIKKLNIYQIYTIIFIFLCIGVFFSFIKSGRSFIWSPDGFKQHFLFFEHFNETIKNAKDSISTFSWNLGLGLDKIGQLSYYVLGDPFAYLSLLCPIKYLKYCYSFLVILRIYCVGLAFIKYCNYHKKSKFATIIGTLIYTFSGYMLFAAIRHPFFANSAIWLPLIFLGVDKILKEDKYKLFTIMSAVSAISNYYFFYMITILTFIYAITKYWTEFKEKGMKTFFKKFLKTTLCYLVGVLSASILLLPTLYAFSNNSRSINTTYTYYNIKYYAKLLFMSENTPFWTKIYTSPLALVFLPIAILNIKKNRENRTWLVNILIQIIILLIPFLGSLMNGFSFQSNRWTFGFCFALSYLITLNIRNDLIYSPKEFKFVKNFLIIYFVLWFLLRKNAGLFPVFTIVFAFIFLIILVARSLDYKKIKKDIYFQYEKNLKSPESIIIKNRIKYVLITAICLNTIFFGWELFSHSHYTDEFVKYSYIEKKYANLSKQLPHFEEAINYIKSIDNSFYRIATNDFESNNEAYKYNFNGLNTYLSIGNKYITELSQDLNILNSAKTNPLREMDSRSRITTLLSSKYYIVPKKSNTFVPYGYKLIYEIKDNSNDKNTAQIYQNENYLPIGVFYDNYILNNEYKNLSPLEKEQALTKTAVIQNTTDIQKYNIKNNKNIMNSISTKEINYKIKDSLKIINLNENKISPKQDKNYFKIKITDTDVKNCELYLLIQNQKYSLNAEYTIYAKYNHQKRKQVIRDKVTSPYYIETPNILFNLGYRDEHKGSITISFETLKGYYTFDNIKLIAVPMNTYNSDIAKLNNTPFIIEKFNDENITGTINNSNDGILQLSTSYSSGWTAYVDGTKTNLIKVNTGFIGLPLSSGNHKIEFIYTTPYLKTGKILSCIGIVLIILIFSIETIRHKKKKGGKNNVR